MPEFFTMHGYGGYVWSAYGVFFVALLVDAAMPIVRSRRALSLLRGRLKREAARGARAQTRSEDST